ncbi:MAG: hypothetical protein ACOC4Y_01440 [bacterium]
MATEKIIRRLMLEPKKRMYTFFVNPELLEAMDEVIRKYGHKSRGNYIRTLLFNFTMDYIHGDINKKLPKLPESSAVKDRAIPVLMKDVEIELLFDFTKKYKFGYRSEFIRYLIIRNLKKNRLWNTSAT